MLQDLVVSQQNGIQTIRMAWSSERPGFNIDTFDIATEAIHYADVTPEVSCNVFLGIPRCFCYGADANSFANEGMLSALSESSFNFFRALINTKKPLIAGVDGIAAGIGMTMLLHFDVVFATPESTFKAPFVEWGLLPDAASTILLPSMLGYRKAFELLCLGAELSPDDAVKHGLVTRIVSSGQCEHAALEAARYLAALPHRPMRTTRELLRQNRTGLIRQARRENALFQELLGDSATQKRLRVMGRAVKMALNSKQRFESASPC